MSENEKLTRELDVACLILQTRLHNQEAVIRYINRDGTYNSKWQQMLDSRRYNYVVSHC